jgi:exonuclease III
MDDLLILDDLNANLNLHIPVNPNPHDPHSFNPELPVPNIDSKFYDTPLFLNSFPTSSPILASINIQSLQSKHEKLTTFLANSPIQILALQETWHIRYPEYVRIPGYNFVHTQRPEGRGGGVGFYIAEHLNFKILQNYSTFIPNSFESLTIEVRFGNKPFIFSSVYRSPTPPPPLTPAAHMDSFIDNLDSLLSNLSSQNTPAFICLDSNINLLKNSPILDTYSNTFLSHSFIQLIHKATRFQGATYTLIDHILTNHGMGGGVSGVIIDDLSDHFVTFVVLPFKGIHRRKGDITTRCYSSTNIENFKNHLGSLAWIDVLSELDVNQAYDRFFATFKELFELNFPPVNKKFNRNFHKCNNFMTAGLLVSRRRKLQLQKISIKDPSVENISAFKLYRNLYNRILRASKKLYFDNNLKKAKKNPKKTWSLLKEAIGQPPSKEKIEKVVVNDTPVTDPINIAESFNNFFAGVPQKIVNDIPVIHTTPESFLPNKTFHEMQLPNTSQAEIVSIIRAMQSKSSTDLDGIPMKILKLVALEIGLPLSHICNLSLSSGTFPSSMKAGKVIPVHKAGDKSLCDNYRPIALLNTFSKILEKVMANRLVDHLDFNKIIDPNQYGFQRSRNTEHNLLQVINYISNELNNGNYCVGVFLDLRKAFDTVSHDILLKKLAHYGITGIPLRWFTSYLADRTQQVEIEGSLSRPCPINISILQGSILGPILFLIQINDLPGVTNLKTFLFADDTQGLKGGKVLSTLIDEVNRELKKWAVWFLANKMAVNTAKTKFIVFHTRGRNPNLEGKTLFFDNNPPHLIPDPSLISPLERIHSNHPNVDSRSYKLLGILLDEHLSFNANTNLLLSKLAKSTFIINRSKNFLPKSSLITLYYSLIHSHLSYCPIIASCTSKTNLKKIFLAQKKAIRIITLSKWNDHTDPLFTELKILPYPKMILQAKLHFMHSYHYNYAPPSFNDTWILNSVRYPERELRNADDYYLPRPNLTLFTNLPLYSLPLSWNEAGPSKYHANVALFKFCLRAELSGQLGIQ